MVGGRRPFAYADMQVLQQAVEGAGTLDQQKLATYLHTHTFKTVAGDITFDAGGEWTVSRALVVQFQNVRGPNETPLLVRISRQGVNID